jgi:shikimate kinase
MEEREAAVHPQEHRIDQARGAAIRARLGARCIVLVGMMGSGKSAIGRVLAEALALPYHDSDTEISTAAGLSIAEIFARFGEEYFRAGERRVVARLLAEGPAVLSLGGGAFLAPETRDLIAHKGVSIWLSADVDMLFSRVMRRPGTRPLLETADPKATIAALLEKRAPIYALADLRVESSSASKAETGEAALRALEAHLGLQGEPAGEGAAA